MTEFRSFKDLENFLKKNITKALQDEPPKVVKRVMKRHIDHDVYSVYEPIFYIRRRENGGLADEDNIVIKNKRNNMVEVFNIAKRNMNFSNQYLAPVIEFGHKGATSRGYRGYSFPYPQYAYYYPRPFIRNTRRTLRKSKLHVNAMKKSLKQYGIDSE